MEQERTQVRAGVYARKSVVKDDKDADGIEVQLAKCHKRAKTIKATVIKDFIDSGISASKGLQRPGYLELMEYIKSKRIDIIIVRDQSRISRDEIELFIFLKTAELAGVEIQDCLGTNIKNDLASKVKGLIDADYARQVGINVSAKKRFQAEKGTAPSSHHRPYGYEKNYAKVIPKEAKILKEIASRFLAGESLYAIAKDLNERGDVKYSGAKWTSQDLSKYLNKPEYAALRSFSGEVIAKGSWKPIFTEALHKQLVEALKLNEPFSRNTARKHLLVGILVCNECATPMSGKSPSYICNMTRAGCGGVVRNMKALDEFVIALVHAYIGRMPSTEQKEVEDYTSAEIARLENKIKEAREAYKSEAIELADFVDVRTDADAKIKELRKQQVKAVKLPVADAKAFLDADTDKKRAVIKRVLPIIGVKPTGSKGTRFHPSQLVLPKEFNAIEAKAS